MPEFITSDGAALHYTDRGEGKPLVMLHGWSCSSAFFVRNVDELKKSCRVIAVDFRGHGDSENVTWGHRISRYAKDIWELMEALKLEDVTLLGWSMGASVAWSYIDLFGCHRLGGHISVDQAPRQYFAADWKWVQPGCYDAEALATLSAKLELDRDNFTDGAVKSWFGGEHYTEDDVEFLSSEVKKSPWKVCAELMTDHTHLDWRDLLPRIKLPTLVLVGRHSNAFDWRGSAYVGEAIENARTVMFENSGHLLFYEEPELFNSEVARFVGER